MADENITLTIPDRHVTRALAANNNLDGKWIDIRVRDENGIEGVSTYFCEKGTSTNRQFARRMSKDAYFYTLRASEEQTGRADYQDDVAAVPTPVLDTPGDLVE